ncbi:MAG TPA: hypothetical protein VE422_04685 [Terriglobia bacterium]|nr:hypothetical protein [Terriglobia bacterium]
MRTGAHLGAIEKQWASLYFATVGLAAGFLGSLVKLVSNMIGASIMDLDPLKLLRVYATIKEGPAALVANNGISLLDAFLMHLVVGSIFGAIFMIIMSNRSSFPKLTAFLSAGVAYGLAIWIITFYLLLSWIQPLVNGSAYIVNETPWWVAAGSHALYGFTVALVSFPFRNDVDRS